MPKTIKTTKLKRFLWWLSWGLILTGSVLWFVVPYVDKIRAERIAKELTKHYGIVVKYGDPAEFHVSPFPVDNNKNNEMERVADNGSLLNALEGIKSALAKYPPALVRKYLSAVFVTGVFKMYGVQVSGCNVNSWIYVSATPMYDQSGPVFYAETLHHELSTLFINGPYPFSPQNQSNLVVYKASSFPWLNWQLVNETGFKYLNREIDVIRAAGKPRNAKDASSCYKAGFVTSYGMTDMENDVSTYAEFAMEHPDKLRYLALQYPRIAAKTGIFVQFYTSLAPEIAEYFKSVGLQNMPISYQIPSTSYYKDSRGHLIRVDKK